MKLENQRLLINSTCPVFAVAVFAAFMIFYTDTFKT